MNNAISYKWRSILFALLTFAGMRCEEMVNNEQSVETKLARACRAGKIEKVKKLLNANNVNATNPEGKTLLMFACQFGNEDIVDLLLANGADVNAQTKLTERSYLSGQTALFFAIGKEIRCYCPQPRIVKKLLEHGADPNCLVTDEINPRENLQYTTLHDAIEGFFENCILQHDEIVNAYEEIVRLLLKYKASPNKGTLSPLMSLIYPLEDQQYKNRRDALITLVINQGADVNYQNCIGRTPLHEAVQSGDKQLIQLLLDAGADSSIVDQDGKSPLEMTEDKELALWVQNYKTSSQPKSSNASLFFVLLIPVAAIFLFLRKNSP